MTEGAVAPLPAQPKERAARRAMAERHWRIWRGLLLFTGVTTGTVLLSMWQRDSLAVEGCRQRFEYTRGRLAELLARGIVAPGELPVRGVRPATSELRARFRQLMADDASMDFEVLTPPDLDRIERKLVRSSVQDAGLQHELGRLRDAYFERRGHYFYNTGYARHRASAAPVGVCCCKSPHHLFLRADGRHVLLFDGREYKLGWLAEAEFQRLAAQLELVVPPSH